MKLYTEEQVRQTFRRGQISEGCTALQIHVDDFIDSLKPIELPIDEEIEDKSISEYPFEAGVHSELKGMIISGERRGFEDGAKWIIDKIKNQQK